MLIKSDQIINDIVNLTKQISTESSLYRNTDDRPLLAPHNLELKRKEINDFRNALIEQFKDPSK